MQNNTSDKWKIPEKYDWGEIYRLKDEYRDSDKLKYLSEDPSKGYWFIGTQDERGINHEKYSDQIAKKDFGFKYWEFKKNNVVEKKDVVEKEKHKAKVQRNSTEYNFVLEGEIVGYVENENDSIVLSAGDFVVIKPGFVINLQKEIKKDVRGITIKIPLIENDDIKEDRFQLNKQ